MPGRWRGSCKDLLQQLVLGRRKAHCAIGAGHARRKRSPGAITLAAPSLRKKGIAIERSRAHGIRSVSITTAA